MDAGPLALAQMVMFDFHHTHSFANEQATLISQSQRVVVCSFFVSKADCNLPFTSQPAGGKGREAKAYYSGVDSTRRRSNAKPAILIF